MFQSHFLLIFLQHKDRINWDTADSDLVVRYTQGFEVGARFINRDEVLFVMMTEPHCMNVEVGDDYRLPTGEALFGFEPRDNLSRQEVCADDHVGLVFAQQFDERARVEFIER